MLAKAESSKGKRCAQLFLTVSPKLCLAVKGHYIMLCESWQTSAKSSQRVTLVETSAEDPFADMEDVPRFQDLKDEDFPLFWPFGYLLRVLDRSIPGPKFWGFKKSESGFVPPAEIDWERFQTHYMHRMPLQAQKKFTGGSVLFGEFQTVIKGSLEAVETAQPLSRTQYLETYHRRDNMLSEADMNLIYDCFGIYQSATQTDNEWDASDAVVNLYSRCRDHPEVCQSFELETLAIDEVQDLVSPPRARLQAVTGF
jgi:hypothetical protein